MKLGHLSDLHFDAQRQIAGELRRDAQGRNVALVNAGKCLRSVAKRIASSGLPDLWIITGDVFDRAQPSAAEESEAIRCLVDLARAAPVVVIAGNHDIPGTAGAATALECLKRRPRIHVVEEPTTLLFQRGKGGLVLMPPPFGTAGLATVADLAVACIPYPRRSEFATSEAMNGAATTDERNAIASALLAQLVTGLRVQCAALPASTPKVLLYHGSIAGAMTRFQPRDLRGDIGLTRDAFDGWDYVGVGHIHQQQEIPGTDGRVWYAGSVDRCDFGEEGEPKGGLAVELDGGACHVTPVESPAQLFTTLTPDEFRDWGIDPDDKGRIAYRVKGAVTGNEARELRASIAAAQSAGAWLADALTVESEVRLRDAHASAEEAPDAFLRRWLDGREGLADTAGRVGMTRETFTEAVVARHGGTV